MRPRPSGSVCHPLLRAEDLDDVVGAVAAQLAALPGVAVASIKRSAVHGVDGSLSDGLDLEGRLLTELGATHDAREGVAAFLGRRKPSFLHS